MNQEVSKLYNLEFDERTDYLYAYASGDKDNVEICTQYWHEIADECRRTKYSKVLIVEDIKQSVTTSEMFQIASRIPGFGFSGIKIAFVDQYTEHQAVNEFGGLVATNRGLYAKLFNTIEEAEKWLLS